MWSTSLPNIDFKVGKSSYSFTPLVGMSDAEAKKMVEAIIAGSAGTPPAPTPTPPPKITAKEVAVKFPAVALRALAKERGLITTGGELAVAQRLLDSGWRP
jgi:hypothetical protein